MDINDVMVDMLEAGRQLYCIITRKPFLTVSRVGCEPQDGGSGESVSFTIENECCHDLGVRKVWFLTCYNRRIGSSFLDSGLPLRIPENGRETCSVPLAELKPALNRSVGETVNRVVVLDSNGVQSIGRFKPEAQARLVGEFS